MIQEETQVPRLLNGAIHNFESVLSKRIFWAVMAQLKKGFGVQKDIFENLWVEVPTNVLNNQHYEQLKKASRELQRARFEFNDDELESFSHIVAFPSVHYEKRSERGIRVKVEPDAYKILAELSSGYFWLKIKAMMMLSSKHAQRWYELFSEKKDLGEWKGVEVEYIRKIMGVDELEYKRNSDMLKWVVYEPIKEINEKTELFVTHEPMLQQKRPVIGFDFRIRGQKAKGEAEVYERIERHFQEFKELDGKGKSQEMLRIQRDYSLSAKAFNEIMQNTTLLDAVLEADAKITEGKLTVQTTKAQYMNGVIKKARTLHSN